MWTRRPPPTQVLGSRETATEEAEPQSTDQRGRKDASADKHQDSDRSQPQANSELPAQLQAQLATDQHGPAAQAIRHALSTGENLAVLSPMMPPDKPWNRSKWQASQAYRDAYIALSVPGRINDTAHFGIDVPRLRADGYQRDIFVESGSTVPLIVIGEPNMPVTFTAMDLGRLANGFVSHTVVADAEGRAETTYTAIAGVVNAGLVIAASPACADHVEFTLHVRAASPESE